MHQTVQDSQNRIDCGQDMRLGARARKAPWLPTATARGGGREPEGKVMQEVPGTFAEVRVDLIKTWL